MSKMSFSAVNCFGHNRLLGVKFGSTPVENHSSLPLGAASGTFALAVWMGACSASLTQESRWDDLVLCVTLPRPPSPGD